MGASLSTPVLTSKHGPGQTNKLDATRAVVDALLRQAGCCRGNNKLGLLQFGSDIKNMLLEDDSALHYVVKHQSPEFLETVLEAVKQRLLAEGGQEYAKARMRRLLNEQGHRGRTPLWAACYCGNDEATAICAREGADPWITDRHGKKTPLMIACVMGNHKCVTALLDNMHPCFKVASDGVTKFIDARSVSGFPAITYAVGWNHIECVQTLLDYEPALTLCNSTSSFESTLICPALSTTLHIAANISNLDIAILLLRSYAERSDQMPDPRVYRNAHGLQPWQLARNMLGDWLVQETSAILHPSIPLESFFPRHTLQQRGVPSLSSLAANALRVYLLGTIDTAKERASSRSVSTQLDTVSSAKAIINSSSTAAQSPFLKLQQHEQQQIQEQHEQQEQQLRQQHEQERKHYKKKWPLKKDKDGKDKDAASKHAQQNGASTSAVEDVQRAQREAQRLAQREEREEQRKKWLRRYQLHQAMMHAHSSMNDIRAAASGAPPPYPPSLASEVSGLSPPYGASPLGGSPTGGSSPRASIQGGSPPRGLQEGGGFLATTSPDEIPPGAIGLQPVVEPLTEQEQPEPTDIPPLAARSLRPVFSTSELPPPSQLQPRSVNYQPGPHSRHSRISNDGSTVSGHSGSQIGGSGPSVQPGPASIIGGLPPVATARLPGPKLSAASLLGRSGSGTITLTGMPTLDRGVGGADNICPSLQLLGGAGVPVGDAGPSPPLKSRPSSLFGATSLNAENGPGSVGPRSETDGALCGICFDHNSLLRISGCKHAMCDECAKQLLGNMVNTPLPCPFCRGPISGFECKPSLDCCPSTEQI